MSARTDIEAAARVANMATVQLLDLATALDRNAATGDQLRRAGHAVGLAIVALQHVRPQLRKLFRGLS